MTEVDQVAAGESDTTQTPEPLSPIRPENIQLPLEFNLGQSTAALGLLQSLQPGYVFELAARPEDGVTITVNGASLAKGELVQVGDRLGVRVVEVLKHATDHA